MTRTAGAACPYGSRQHPDHLWRYRPAGPTEPGDFGGLVWECTYCGNVDVDGSKAKPELVPVATVVEALADVLVDYESFGTRGGKSYCLGHIPWRSRSKVWRQERKA
jgi:hypothetical protein